jgi:8-oxo-dGTP diphosphatase
VVAAVIRKDDMIFATARGYGEFKGGWEFPGGKIEEGETPQQALVREIKEELDTDIEVGELIDTIEYDYPTFHLSMDCFWAKVISGELILKEASDAKWLTREQLDSVKWLPADITLIEKINRSLLNDECVKYTEQILKIVQGIEDGSLDTSLGEQFMDETIIQAVKSKTS